MIISQDFSQNGDCNNFLAAVSKLKNLGIFWSRTQECLKNLSAQK